MFYSSIIYTSIKTSIKFFKACKYKINENYY